MSGRTKRKFFRCEVCGDFHPGEEIEIAEIKITKGKNCSIDKIKIININNQNNSSINNEEIPPQRGKIRAVPMPPGMANIFEPPK